MQSFKNFIIKQSPYFPNKRYDEQLDDYSINMLIRDELGKAQIIAKDSEIYKMTQQILENNKYKKLKNEYEKLWQKYNIEEEENIDDTVDKEEIYQKFYEKSIEYKLYREKLIRNIIQEKTKNY